MTQQLRRHAEKLVILMDSSKAEEVKAMYNFETKHVDILISDDNLKKETARALSKDHVTVL